MRPLLYFSYGMTKTGSTLAFQMVRSALDICGFPQDRLDLDVVDRSLRDNNFVNHITPDQLEQLKNEAKKRGYPIALKTHMRPDPCVVEMIQSGEAVAHASYRDPRDMILSMLDHAEKSRFEGLDNFAELADLEQTLVNVRHQFDSLTAWLRLPGTMPLYFEDLGFKTAQSLRRILERLDLNFDPELLSDIVLNHRFTQKNKGVKIRFETEMKPEDSARIAKEFSPFIDRFITNRNRLPLDGQIVLPPPDELRLAPAD